MNAVQVPAPLPFVVIERQQTLFRKRRNKLDCKKCIPSRLLVYQLRQRCNPLGLGVKGIRNQLGQVSRAEWQKSNLVNCTSSPADRLDLAYQRMSRIDFVVPIGADQQQVLDIRPGQQILQQIQCRRVQPLQIVEKQGQRMLWPGKYANESAENQLKTDLRILRRNFGDRWLFPYNEPQFRNQIHDQLAVRI